MRNKIYYTLYVYAIIFSIAYYLFYNNRIDEFTMSTIVIIIVIVEIISLNFQIIIDFILWVGKKLFYLLKIFFIKKQSN